MGEFMSQTIKRIVILSIALGWMLTIFLYSAMPAEESMEQSDGIVVKLIRIFISDFDSLSPAEQTRWLDTLSMLVRKGAHMAEFAILSCLFYATFSVWQWKRGDLIRGLSAWGLATLYAMTDEFHQRFVPGRWGAFTDVLIDSAGALIGAFIAVSIAYGLAARRKRNTD